MNPAIKIDQIIELLNMGLIDQKIAWNLLGLSNYYISGKDVFYTFNNKETKILELE